MLASLPDKLLSNGLVLSTAPEDFGYLIDSHPLLGNAEALRQRMDQDGYLYIRDFFDRNLITAARRSLTEKLAAAGLLDPSTDPAEGRLKAEVDMSFMPALASQNETILRVVFGPELKTFYQNLLGSEHIRHFDYIWMRAMGHGKGTAPHCDIVYMGRGTPHLYTAWIPYGDVRFELGGLMILEQSHLQAERIRGYLNLDVDSYCENRPRPKSSPNGALSKNPVSLREKFGGRWLTTEFRMGDLLTFRADTIHASTDNQTQHIRLSSDTRYQRASELIDERWIGPNPAGHSQAAKRGRIC